MSEQEQIHDEGCRKPRALKYYEELPVLHTEAVVMTSDSWDQVFVKEGSWFRNTNGNRITAMTLWNFSQKPITVLHEGTPGK